MLNLFLDEIRGRMARCCVNGSSREIPFQANSWLFVFVFARLSSESSSARYESNHRPAAHLTGQGTLFFPWMRLRNQLVTDERHTFAVGRPRRYVDCALSPKQFRQYGDLVIAQ